MGDSQEQYQPVSGGKVSARELATSIVFAWAGAIVCAFQHSTQDTQLAAAMLNDAGLPGEWEDALTKHCPGFSGVLESVRADGYEI